MRKAKYNYITDSSTMKKVYKRLLRPGCLICALHRGDNYQRSGHKGKHGVKKPKYKNHR